MAGRITFNLVNLVTLVRLKAIAKYIAKCFTTFTKIQAGIVIISSPPDFSALSSVRLTCHTRSVTASPVCLVGVPAHFNYRSYVLP